jgi:hypothetical protein
MASVLYPPARPQSIGEVLDTAFRIFRRTLLACLPFGVLASVSSQLPYVYTIATGRPPTTLGLLDPLWWAFDWLGVLIWLFFVSVIILRQAAGASGRRLGVRESLAAAMRKLPALFGLVLLALAAGLLCAAPLALLPRAYLMAGGGVALVPAIFFVVYIFCATFALLIAEQGVFGSIRQGFFLLRGNWWRSATIYSTGFVIVMVFYILATILAVVLLSFIGGDDVAVFTAMSTVTVGAMSTFGIPFYTSVGLALYGDLESRRQGRDLERRIAGATVS